MTSGDPPRLRVPVLPPTGRLVALPPVRLGRAANGAAPRLPTALRVAQRDGKLLVRFDGRDDGVVATLTRRDDPLWTEDVFEVFLSPEPESGVYYEFEANPLGALFDARVESPEGRRETMRVDASWDCPGYSARVRRRTGLWSALLTLPLAPLAGREPPRLWRANFYRVDRAKRTAPAEDEYSAWSPVLCDPPDFHRPARFGFLELEGESVNGSSRAG